MATRKQTDRRADDSGALRDEWLKALADLTTKVDGEWPGPRDLRSADENLEGTYLVHMFAEFETGVHCSWRAI